MVTWMVYAVLVGALLAVGARAVEEGVRALGRPVRFVWAAALVGTVALTALGPLRAPEPMTIRVSGAEGVELEAVAGASSTAGMADALRAVTSGVRKAVTWPVGVARSVEPGGSVSRALAGVWAALAVAVTLLGLGTFLRYRAARRGWPRRELCGVPVRVSPSAGPAVLGLVRPEIVVPRWLVERPEEEQRVVVLHESEHVRARDGWTLAVGWAAVAVLPWNPAVWWLWKRLRLAVELDCDARVLRHDVARRAYGTMLIDLAGRGSGLTLGVPALSGSPTTLERRLMAMTAPFKQGKPFRAAAFAALGALAVVAACESGMPTAAEVEELDAATAEDAARKLELAGAGGENVTFYVDGRAVDAEEAKALAPEELERVRIVREDGTDGATIHLRTVAGGELTEGAEAPAETRIRAVSPGAGAFDGLLIIDGEEAPASRMNELRPDDIAGIEVIKGPAATALSDDPRAARGIIRVTTKAAAAGG